MTSIHQKINQFKAKVGNSQAGVTLLISVLVVSGVLLIVSTVAFFTIQEIRASRAVSLSEPAISAAQSGGELGVWAIKRGIDLGCGSSSLSTNTKVDYCKSYGPAVLSVSEEADYSFFLENPDDPTDTDLSNFRYFYLKVTNQSSAYAVNVSIERIDGTGVEGGTASVAPNSTKTVTIPQVTAGQEARMKVTLSSQNGDALVEVDTNQGMVGFPTVDSSGCATPGEISECSDAAETFKRRINITVPQ